MKFSFEKLLLLVCVGLAADVSVAQDTLIAARIKAVPTFNCVGLYWHPEVGALTPPNCPVRYRKVGELDWREAMPLWFDDADHPGLPEHSQEYRGSIVELESATTYEIALGPVGDQPEQRVTVETWNDQFPIARTVVLPENVEGTYLISEGGSDAEGYVLYTSPPSGRTLIDGRDVDEVNIRVEASHVILRGLDLRAARMHGIELGTVHDVVIEDCDISGWGEDLDDGWGRNFDSAIYHETADDAPRVLRRIVIQNNRLHHPRSHSNSWLEARESRGGSKHPIGPQGISFINGLGEIVIRYNWIYSDYEHMFNDSMGEYHNFSYAGFPGRDSDIYGNRISHCFDDGIEMEGANMNVRCWRNVIDWTFIGIGAAGTSLGPSYVFRNIYLHSRRGPGADEPSYRGQAFLKLGADPARDEFAHGRAYVFHNTTLQPPAWGGFESTSGAGRGLHLTSSTKVQTNVVSRNNVLWTRDSPGTAVNDGQPLLLNDFDYDLFNGRVEAPPGAEANGIRAMPRFSPAFDSDRPWTVALAPGSPGHDQAVRIPNFNDDFRGDGPDMGAFEAGLPVPEDFPNASASPSRDNPAYWPITETPGLPRVLLLGDSISIAYTLPVRAHLQGRANVLRPPENCRDSGWGLKRLDEWLTLGTGNGKWDVIHFNFGLHDVKYLDAVGNYVSPDEGVQVTSLADYERNLRQLIARLRRTGAKLVFATTTPVPAGAQGRVVADVAHYNAVAKAVMEETGIEVDDLFAVATKMPPGFQQPRNVHFTASGTDRLALAVSESVERVLSAPPSHREVAVALGRATDFMTTLAVEGGFVWTQSITTGDRKGEEPVTPTQIWVQPPGTPAMGSAFLRAYAATGDPRQLEAARAAAVALARGQLESGGWSELIDFDPVARRHWRYRVDGDARSGATASTDEHANVSTYDDDKTQSALRFLLAFADETMDSTDARDQLAHDALDYGLRKALESQYANGAWPQRWNGVPPNEALHPVIAASLPATYPREFPDTNYFGDYTFNDDTLRDMIGVMLDAYRRTGREEFRAAARRAADFIVLAQLPDPQSAWAQQYDPAMHPDWARVFEPPAVSSYESAGVVRMLLDLADEFSDPRYLTAAGRAVEWFRRSAIGPDRWARYYELHTNRPIYGDRDGKIHYTLGELSAERQTGYNWEGSFGIAITIASYEQAMAAAHHAAEQAAPAAVDRTDPGELVERVRRVLGALDEQGRWLEPDGTHVSMARFIEQVDVLVEYLVRQSP